MEINSVEIKKILIISTSFAEQEMLEKICIEQGNTSYRIQSTASFGQAADWWTKSGPDLLLVKLPSDDDILSMFVKKLHADVPKNQRVLLTCGEIHSSIMQLSTHFQKMRIVNTPTDNQLYRSVVDLLSDYTQSEDQIHARYNTDQEIFVTKAKEAGSIKAVMKNISVTGAYFECLDNSLNLVKDDKIQIKIVIPQVRDYFFDAKIMWVKQDISGQYAFGVAFVDQDQILKTMMKE